MRSSRSSSSLLGISSVHSTQFTALTRIDLADLQDILVRSSNWLAISSAVQIPRHQSVWEVRSVQFGAAGPSALVQFIQSSLRTLPALTLGMTLRSSPICIPLTGLQLKETCVAADRDESPLPPDGDRI